jgi:hypothetical protein
VLHPIHATTMILHPNLRDLSPFSWLGQQRMIELRERALLILEQAMRETPNGKDLAPKSEADGLLQSHKVKVHPENAPGTSSTFSLVSCFDVYAAADERSISWNPKDEIEKNLGKSVRSLRFAGLSPQSRNRSYQSPILTPSLPSPQMLKTSCWSPEN